MTNALSSVISKLKSARQENDKKKVQSGQNSLNNLAKNIGRFGTKYGLKELEGIAKGSDGEVRMPRKKITFDMIKNSNEAIEDGAPLGEVCNFVAYMF